MKITLAGTSSFFGFLGNLLALFLLYSYVGVDSHQFYDKMLMIQYSQAEAIVNAFGGPRT